MSNPPPSLFRIVHFDDEVNTVFMIPNSLFNYFENRRESWIDPAECFYDKFVRFFRLQVPGFPPLRIEYVLTSDVEECKACIRDPKHPPDVLILDLMRERDKLGPEPIGRDLFKLARKQRLPEDRIFILTGFPALFSAHWPDCNIPESQIMSKPQSSNEIAARIVRMLPSFLHIE